MYARFLKGSLAEAGESQRYAAASRVSGPRECEERGIPADRWARVERRGPGRGGGGENVGDSSESTIVRSIIDYRDMHKRSLVLTRPHLYGLPTVWLWPIATVSSGGGGTGTGRCKDCGTSEPCSPYLSAIFRQWDAKTFQVITC